MQQLNNITLETQSFIHKTLSFGGTVTNALPLSWEGKGGKKMYEQKYTEVPHVQ